MTKKNFVVVLVSYSARGGRARADAIESFLRGKIEGGPNNFHVEKLEGVDRDEELEDDIRRVVEDMLSDEIEEE